MKKFLIMLLFAQASMTASIDFISYDEEEQLVDLHISYCYCTDIEPVIELSDEYCQESFPETCFVSLIVHGEPFDYADSDICVGEIITYDVAHIDHPVLLVFQTDDGSEGGIWVGGPIPGGPHK